MTNIELFTYSINHKENMLDRYYNSDINILDYSNREAQNILKNNNKLIDIIDEYAKLRKTLKEHEKEVIYDSIIKLLKKPNMNLNCFSQYFSVHDTSFTVYDKFSGTQKKYFISTVLDHFIENRHTLYNELNYSNMYLQVLYDSHAHKRMTKHGVNKVQQQLCNAHYKISTKDELQNMTFITPDSIGKNKFIELIKSLNIDFVWMNSKQNKIPDMIFMNNNNIYILEHKHVKESGGGQGKQISEIIDFISHKEANVSYISYMDGIYFNSYDNPNFNNKLYEQKNQIIRYLTENSNNFFVNTSGFEKLLKTIN